MPTYGNIPRPTIEDADVVASPAGDGAGHWVGAPSVCRHDDRTFLALRRRDPDRRGFAISIHERVRPARSDGVDGTEFTKLVELRADELGVVSVERPALVADPASGELKLYVPVEHGENDWTIQRLADVDEPAAFDPATAHDVLTPASNGTDRATVKDPYVVAVGGRYFMYYAGHDGRSEQAHLATSPDGVTWTRSSANPVLARGGWHGHHTRVSAVVPAPDAPAWLVLYDGSGTEDYGNTWNLRTGTAVTHDLSGVVDATPNRPWLSAGMTDQAVAIDRFDACRYLDVLRHEDTWECFAEVAREDGAFELRRTVVANP